MGTHERRQAGTMTPVGAVAAGSVAGAVGTAAMDGLRYRWYRRGGGTQAPLAWEFSAGLDKWDDASVPGQLGKRLLEGLLGYEVPNRWARATQNAMHWATGLAWGVEFGLVAGSVRRPSWRWGLALGPAAWLAGYVVLPPTGLYRPIWKYDAATLGKDLGGHMAFGLAAGLVFAGLARCRPGS